MMYAKLEAYLTMAQQKISHHNLLLDEYIDIVKPFSKLYVFGGGNDGRLVADFLIEAFPEKEIIFVDNDTSKHKDDYYRGYLCCEVEKLSIAPTQESMIFIGSTKYGKEMLKQIAIKQISSDNYSYTTLQLFDKIKIA